MRDKTDEAVTLKLNQAVQEAIGVSKPYDRDYRMHLSTEDKRIISSNEFAKGIACGKKYLKNVAKYRTAFELLNIADDRFYKTISSFSQEFDEFPGFFTELEQYDNYCSLSIMAISEIICWWLEIGNEYAPYLEAKITNAESPSFIGDARVRINSVIDNTQVNVCFDKGITPKIYNAVWGGLKTFLERDTLIIEEKQQKHNDLDRHILRDWQKGMSYTELVRKYYPDEDTIFNKKDAIAKLVRRSGLERFNTPTKGKRGQSHKKRK